MCLELRYISLGYFKFIFIMEDFIQFPSMFYNVKSIFCHGPVGCVFVLLLVMVGCFVGVFLGFFCFNLGCLRLKGWDYMGGGRGAYFLLFFELDHIT